MSIVAHGRSTFAWVCRCRIGLASSLSPAIHILAGEKVCIQVITPTHSSLELASRQARRIESALVRTGFQITRT